MKAMISTLTKVLCALALSAHVAIAAPLTADDQAALTARIDSFRQTFESGDLSKIGDVIPPKILAVMAEQFGMPAPELLDAMSAAMEHAMQNVTIDGYSMDQGAAASAETTSGRTYLLIPTQTLMTVDGATQIESNTQTLAFADEGVWYLLRIDDAQQIHFLTRAYPEFSGINFPAGTVAVVNE